MQAKVIKEQMTMPDFVFVMTPTIKEEPTDKSVGPQGVLGV